MTRKPFSISLDGELMDEIEEKRGAIPRSRFIELLIIRTLREEEHEEEMGAGYA